MVEALHVLHLVSAGCRCDISRRRPVITARELVTTLISGDKDWRYIWRKHIPWWG